MPLPARFYNRKIRRDDRDVEVLYIEIMLATGDTNDRAAREEDKSDYEAAYVAFRAENPEPKKKGGSSAKKAEEKHVPNGSE